MQLVKGSKSLLTRGFSSIKPSFIDVHTHMYLPKYMKILESRAEIPKVVTVEGTKRLVILPGEDKEISTSTGRPIGREYFDVEAKLQYMNKHHISHSVISLANPWLDFLSGNPAQAVAQELNDELESICENSKGRLYGFATLPVRNPEAAVKEVQRLKKLPHIRGVILGTPGAGKGIDHEDIRPVLAEIERENLMIFLHPHYGVGVEHFYGTGHAMFLALGFPFETTIAVSRLILTGAFDQLPKLKLLVAHAGAALPMLIGRLDSCVKHDHLMCNKLKHDPHYYFNKLYFDAISYSLPALECLLSQLGPNGKDRVMFGTDHPFFPPLHPENGDIFSAAWDSTVNVQENIGLLSNLSAVENVVNKNASRLLNIPLK